MGESGQVFCSGSAEGSSSSKIILPGWLCARTTGLVVTKETSVPFSRV